LRIIFINVTIKKTILKNIFAMSLSTKQAAWATQKKEICIAYYKGDELLRSEEDPLVNKFSGENKVECLANGVGFIDETRVKGTYVALGVMVDTRVYNTNVLSLDETIWSDAFKSSQPVVIGKNSTMDAQVYSINAGNLLIPNFARGKKGQTAPLFSQGFYDMWDECYQNAGGRITGFGTNPWKNFFQGASEEVKAPVYLNICACKEDTHFAASQRTYNHGAIVLTVTSGGQFSIEYIPANSTTIKDSTTGVWAKHGAQLNVCALKVTASNEEYSVEGVEAMTEQIADNSGTSSKGLFPFRGNSTYNGCWVMTVSFPVHKVVVEVTRSIFRGGATRSIGGGTRSGGGATYSNDVDPTGFYFPTMECGDVIKPMKALPHLEQGVHYSGTPTVTFNNIIVQGESTVDKTEKMGKNLVKTALTQIDCFEKMLGSGSQNIHDSVHSIAKEDLTEDQMEIYKTVMNYFDL
jgi:hypothetical protein